MTLKAISVAPNSYQNLVETDRALVDTLANAIPGVIFAGATGTSLSAITNLQVTPGTGHTVNVGAGKAVIREKTSPVIRGAYFFQADAIEASVALPVPDTQPFIATVIARVTDPQYGTVTGNVGARIDVIKGTPASSPTAISDATIDAVTNTPGGWTRLADVRVNTGDTGVVPSGQFTDVRKPGGFGTIICLSTNRPSSPSIGQSIFELDTKAYGWYDGTAWRMYDTQWQTETNGAKFSHSGSGGMTGNTCILKYMRAGKLATVSWVGTTQAGTNYGSHGSVLLGLPTGLIGDSTGIPRGVYRSTVGNTWHHGILIFPPGDGSQLFAVYANNAGGVEAYVTTTGSISGNFITAEAVVELV